MQNRLLELVNDKDFSGIYAETEFTEHFIRKTIQDKGNILWIGQGKEGNESALLFMKFYFLPSSFFGEFVAWLKINKYELTKVEKG